MEPGVYCDQNRHTCICLSVSDTTVKYIPLSITELAVHKMHIRSFAREWKPMKDYAVARAAQLYLHPLASGVPAPVVTPEAKAHLERLAGKPFVRERLDDVDPRAILNIPGESTMATAKKTEAAPAKRPAAKKTEAAPAKRPASKKAAPAAAEESTGRRGRPPAWGENDKFKVVNGESVSRGAYRQIVDVAEKLGEFTFAKLQAAVEKTGVELAENQLKNTFAFGLRKGVFGAA